MATTATITASRREDTATGKGAARAFRRDGRVPGVVYGHGENTVPVTVDQIDLHKLVHSISIENTIVDLNLDGGAGGGTFKVLIREVQQHPYRGELLHVDFFHVAMDEMIRVEVPIVLEGSPEGVRNKGGILDHPLREIEVRCLPGNIPERIVVDVTGLDIGDSIHVRDLDLPDVEIETDMDRAVAAVLPPTVVVEPDAEAAAEAPAEPEVIRRERDTDEEA